jgi:hypothetical protein
MGTHTGTGPWWRMILASVQLAATLLVAGGGLRGERRAHARPRTRGPPVRRSRRRRPGVAVDLLMFALVYVAVALLGIRHQWLTFRATEHDIVNDSLGSNAASSDVLRET